MRTQNRFRNVSRRWGAVLLVVSAQFCSAGAGQSNPVAPPINVFHSPMDDGTLPVAIRLAQARTTGDLYVEVTDQDGNALPGATVTLTGHGQQQIAITNAQGQARFLGLDVGGYKMTTRLDGFTAVEYPRVEVRLGGSTSVDIAISPVVEETITVTSESPLLDERKIRTGTSISQIELERIPTARDPWSVLQSTPGVLFDRVNVGGTESGAGAAGNTFLIDGVDFLDGNAVGAGYYAINEELLNEVKVSTDAGSAASTASAILNVVTKHGSSALTSSSSSVYGTYLFMDHDVYDRALQDIDTPKSEAVFSGWGGRSSLRYWGSDQSGITGYTGNTSLFPIRLQHSAEGGLGYASPGGKLASGWSETGTLYVGISERRRTEAMIGPSARVPPDFFSANRSLPVQLFPVTIDGDPFALGGIGVDRRMFTAPRFNWEWLMSTAAAQAQPPPAVSMLQVPTDATFEGYGFSLGESKGPLLVHGVDAEMPNAAWNYPGAWQTLIAVGPDQTTAFVTAPEWLSGESVFMVDDTVIRAKTKATAVELAQAAWKTASTGPDGNCQPVFDADAVHPAQRWMLLRTRLSDNFVRLFALNLGGAVPHWAELDVDGRARRFGSGLRYDPAGKLLWLIGGTTEQNRRVAYAVHVPVLGLRWLSLTDPSSAIDASANPFKLCVGAAVAAPEKPTGAAGGPDRAPQPAKLAACKQLRKLVPKKIAAAALAAPHSVPGHGQTCYPAAPPLAPNPERSKLSLRTPGRPYHPLYNPLTAACDCSAGV